MIDRRSRPSNWPGSSGHTPPSEHRTVPAGADVPTFAGPGQSRSAQPLRQRRGRVASRMSRRRTIRESCASAAPCSGLRSAAGPSLVGHVAATAGAPADSPPRDLRPIREPAAGPKRRGTRRSPGCRPGATEPQSNRIQRLAAGRVAAALQPSIQPIGCPSGPGATASLQRLGWGPGTDRIRPTPSRTAEGRDSPGRPSLPRVPAYRRASSGVAAKNAPNWEVALSNWRTGGATDTFCSAGSELPW